MRRVTAALVVTAVVALAVVGTAAVFIARRIALDNALGEAVRTAQSTADVVFAPAVPGLLAHAPGVIARLDAAVDVRRRDGLVLRVKVWTQDGLVLYSDDHAAIGRRYPLDSAVHDAIVSGTSTADVSTLSAAENVTEARLPHHLVEVYTPVRVADGTRLAFEIYASDAQVRAAEAKLVGDLVPLALLSPLVLIVLQLPVSVRLVRGLARAGAERTRLLGRALRVSENERRTIAHDLHDSVVQDLAGVGYALGSMTARVPAGAGDEDTVMLDRVSTVVLDAVRSLRTLIVDIYPPELSITGMGGALSQLAEPLRAAGVEAVVTADDALGDGAVSADVTAMLYRCAREALINVAKHAHASAVSVDLDRRGDRVVLAVRDDGTGLPASGIDTLAQGHLGLRLLRDGVADMGGRLVASTRVGGGTEVLVELPATAVAAF